MVQKRKRFSRKKKLKKGVKNFLTLVCLIIIGILLYKIFWINSDTSNVLFIEAPQKVYLADGQIKKPNIIVKTNDDKEGLLVYSSDNENIVEVNSSGYFQAKGIGEATIKVSDGKNISKDIKVIVSDLIVNPSEENNDKKKNLQCKIYSEEEESILNEILASEVKEAGENTRAGVVAAARFLTLEFPYKINYFYENGRLQGTDPERAYIDAEGRYYHKGLYLTEANFALLDKNARTSEPKPWGCDMYSYSTKSYSRNGLNCSGFISWAMLNGGFDVGDIGAGITNEYDFTDIGEKVKIDADLLNSGRVKVGDLIGRNGHIAIIIGLEDDKIYVSESYIPNLKLRIFTKQELIDSEDFVYIMLMDSYYKEDGNLTNKW